MKTFWRNALTALLAVTLFATFAYSQSVVTGDLTGTVTDPSGAVIPNANVSIKNDASGESQSTHTNDQGQYRFSLLKPGSYTLAVQASGLANTERHVVVSLGQVTNVPVKVGIAGTSTTVEVTEQTPLIDTENANLATTYSTTQLAALPTPGNDVTSYAYTAPGVTLNTGSGYGNFSAYGLPSTANLFTTNGNDNMDPYLNLNNSGASNLALGANELQEIAVVNNGYTAQYGRQAGAQVNASTKSGTNQFHGNALYWWNGTALNANDWFSAGSGTPRPHAVNNQWAASVGGPIVKNKLFFFADTEGLRFVLPGASGANYLPTPAFAQYVLGNVNTTTPGSLPFYQQMFNLYAGAPGGNRATPVTLVDDPSGGGGCGDFAGTAGFGSSNPCAMTFRSNQNNLNTEWLLITRIDWNISNNDRLFGRFKTDHGVQATGTDPINPIFNANSVQPAYEGQLNETHIFGGNAVNQLIVSGSWYSALFTANNLPGALAAFPTTMAFNDGLLTTLGGTDNIYPQGRVVTQYQIIDDFSKTFGRHDLKFGGNFRRNLVSDYAPGVNTSGTLNINSMTDFVVGNFFSVDNPNAAGVSDYTQAFANVSHAQMKLYSLGVYAQDQWKATDKLSLTLALRFDRNSNPACKENCFARLAGPFQNLPHDQNVPYNGVIRTGLNNAFQGIEPIVVTPRLGVAYSVTPTTVLRGGIGLFTDLFPGTLVDRFFTQAPNVASFGGGIAGGPISPDVSNNIFAQAAAANAGFQAGFANGATLADLKNAVPGFTPPLFNAMNSKLYNPKFLEWNFQIEQQLGKDYSVAINYVGNHGYDEMLDNPWMNAFCKRNCPFGPIANTTATDPRFAQVRGLNNSGWSNYNGVSTSFKFRIGNSFQGQANYTWSHALDTCSNSCLLPFMANTVVSIRYMTSPNLPGTAYGNADYDSHNVFNMNYVYNSKSNWNNGFARAALSGWTIAGTLFFHTGYPWSAVSTSVRGDLGNVTGLRNGTPLADFLGGPANLGGCNNPNVPCVVSEQFATGATQSGFGNIARNTFRGPSFFDTDLNLTKNFKVTERLGFALGANFFNLLNHPNFDIPNNNVPAGNFGVITNTVAPATSPYGAFLSVPLTGRIVQLNARLTF
jgi:hypothetical protein